MPNTEKAVVSRAFFADQHLNIINQIELVERRLEAERYLNRGVFHDVIDKKAVELSGRVLRPDLAFNSDRYRYLLANDSAFLSIVWNEAELSYKENSVDAIVIEALYNNSIVIHGDRLVGTTVLTQLESSNLFYLHKALKKAEHYPIGWSVLLSLNGDGSEDKLL